jgi:hypothetical protein
MEDEVNSPGHLSRKPEWRAFQIKLTSASKTESRINPRFSVRPRVVHYTVTLLFLLTFSVYSACPVTETSDALYSMILSESILNHGSTHLNGYRFPGKIPELVRFSAPPLTPPPGSPHTYQLGRINGNVVYVFSNGSSVLSIPFVFVANTLGLHAANKDGVYNPGGELLMMRAESALLMALLACVIFLTGLLMLDPGTSFVVALGFAFGTQMFSLATRTLWSHTWFIFLGGFVVYQLVLAESKGQKISGAAVGTFLFLMYFVRPTGIIPIACITAYMLLCQRQRFLSFAITGAFWLAALMTYWWHTFGTILPGYYRSRADLTSFTQGLEVNLIGPSRGLLVYVPMTIFIIYLVVRYWDLIPIPSAARTSVAIILLQLFAAATYPNWWGGYCYGARLMTDSIPFFALLAIAGLAAAKNSPTALRGSQVILGMLLLLLSVVINARGAMSLRTQFWNVEVDLDRHPERAMDWSYPQFAAGLVSPPAYVDKSLSRLISDNIANVHGK